MVNIGLTCQSLLHRVIDRITQFYDLLVFGSGKHSIVPVLWMLWIAFLGYEAYGFFDVPDSIKIIFILGVLIDIPINLFFGFQHLKENSLSKFITLFTEKYGKDKETIERIVSKKNYFMLALVLLFCIFIINVVFLIGRIGYEKLSVGSIIINCIMFFTLYVVLVGSSIYLCAVWCYQLWILDDLMVSLSHHVAIHVKPIDLDGTFLPAPAPPSVSDTAVSSYLRRNLEQPSISGDIILTPLSATDAGGNDQSTAITEAPPTPLAYRLFVEKMLFTFLHDIRLFSNGWKINHIFRCITGVMFGFSELVIAILKLQKDNQDDDENGHSAFSSTVLINILLVCLYFGMIWLTAISAGYVNDHFFSVMIGKCVHGYRKHHNVAQDHEMMIVMQKLLAARHHEGLFFAGISMSVEKAFSVGSILISIIVFACRFFFST